MQCASCALSIAGRIVSAAGQRFHPHCFTCHHCAEGLECVAFYPEPEKQREARLARIQARLDGNCVPEDKPGETAEEDGDESLRFYCHLDFHELFSPRCKSCKTPIESEVIVACGSTWHVGHFFCAECGDPFDAKKPFVEKDGYAWCLNCHAGRFSGRCKGCRKPVVTEGIRALDAEWHIDCFVCKVSPRIKTSVNSCEAEQLKLTKVLGVQRRLRRWAFLHLGGRHQTRVCQMRGGSTEEIDIAFHSNAILQVMIAAHFSNFETCLDKHPKGLRLD